MCNQSETPIQREANGSGPWEQLRGEVVGELLYYHDRANTNTSKTLEVMAFAYALSELMLDKGLLRDEP